MTQGWHREPRSADCDYGCEYRWTLRHGWQMAPNLACREHIRERGRDVLGDLHAVYGETQEGVPIMTGDLPEPVAIARGGYINGEYVVNVESNISRENMDALMGRFPGLPELDPNWREISDPMNSPTLADLYPDDEPPQHRRNYAGDPTRVRGGYTVTHEGRTPGEIIREYGRLYGAGEVVHEDDLPWSRPDADVIGDIRRVRDRYPVSRSMGAAWDEYPARMREHMQRLRDQVGGLHPDDLIVDEATRDEAAALADQHEWEAIDPRRRQAIANWTMTDRGRSGLLGKADYPPGALVRNPPDYWTPEAHP